MVLGNSVENVASLEVSDNMALLKYAYQKENVFSLLFSLRTKHEFGT